MIIFREAALQGQDGFDLIFSEKGQDGHPSPPLHLPRHSRLLRHLFLLHPHQDFLYRQQEVKMWRKFTKHSNIIPEEIVSEVNCGVIQYNQYQHVIKNIIIV